MPRVRPGSEDDEQGTASVKASPHGVRGSPLSQGGNWPALCTEYIPLCVYEKEKERERLLTQLNQNKG